jgi:hypothetical protein
MHTSAEARRGFTAASAAATAVHVSARGTVPVQERRRGRTGSGIARPDVSLGHLA